MLGGGRVAVLLTDRAIVQRGEESGEINEASLMADASYTSPNPLLSHGDRPRVPVTGTPSVPKFLFFPRHTGNSIFVGVQPD